MIEIIPALMPKSVEDIESFMNRYKDIESVSFVQLDIMDGVLTPYHTWPFGIKEQKQEQDKLMSLLEVHTHKNLELDLMIFNPFDSLSAFMKWKPRRVIIHAKAISEDEYLKFLEGAHFKNTEFGIAFTVDDSIDDFKKLIQEIDFVQCMGISQIGVQGSLFNEKTYAMIQHIKQQHPQVPISVDGGVSMDNCKALKESGVDRLVSGSLLRDAEKPEDMIQLVQS